MRKEYRNLFKRCVNPYFLLITGLFFFSRMKARFQRKIFSKQSFYPSGVRKKINIVYSTVSAINEISEKNDFHFNSNNQSIIIHTVLGFIPYIEDKIWQTSFDDDEKTSSIHRFLYVMYWFNDESNNDYRENLLCVLRNWIKNNERHSSVAWESYTVSEQLSNIILFFLCEEKRENQLLLSLKIPEDIRHFLLNQATYLSNNLEYHEKQATGNHVLNNARALYIVGQVLKQPYFSDIARNIIKNDLPILIDTDGFLREGSSHYQFLITRWILEIIWVAELTGDIDFVNFLLPAVKKLVSKCWFFLVFDEHTKKWYMPLIGDVSPDCQWEWLIGLPWSSLAMKYYQPSFLPKPPVEKGWKDLFIPEENISFQENKLNHDLIFQEFSESGWYRLDFGKLTMFWHVEPLGSPLHASHAHCDIASFVLYWEGEVIFIDSGRFNYKLDEAMGLYGMSASAHNAVTIDDFDPFIYTHRSHFPNQYRAKKIRTHSIVANEVCIFTIEHDGFSRIAGDKINFRREFHITKKQLMIKDYFNGKRRHKIQSHFHFGPTVSVLKTNVENEMILKSKHFDASFSISKYFSPSNLFFGSDEPKPLGWYCQHYTKKQEINTLQCESDIEFPVSMEYILKWSAV